MGMDEPICTRQKDVNLKMAVITSWTVTQAARMSPGEGYGTPYIKETRHEVLGAKRLGTPAKTSSLICLHFLHAGI